ncbi:unnamed protein product [Ranitomeya imitator]|uniref:Uncharacterized protein n=1 Tax=Ranitomeya imitator TaxID=111125 RepID=A0ABN9KRP7_9NEOB|nr:unnamed protein product [Ranitomeya imitator]
MRCGPCYESFYRFDVVHQCDASEYSRTSQSYDVKGPPTHRLSCGQSPYTETTTWERKYCILTESQLVLLNREDEMSADAVQDSTPESTKSRSLRRTVSVPSEGQFPEYPPEGASKLAAALSSASSAVTLRSEGAVMWLVRAVCLNVSSKWRRNEVRNSKWGKCLYGASYGP